MKKVVIAMVAFVLISASGFAQTTQAATKTPTAKTQTVKPAEKTSAVTKKRHAKSASKTSVGTKKTSAKKPQKSKATVAKKNSKATQKKHS